MYISFCGIDGLTCHTPALQVAVALGDVSWRRDDVFGEVLLCGAAAAADAAAAAGRSPSPELRRAATGRVIINNIPYARDGTWAVSFFLRTPITNASSTTSAALVDSPPLYEYLFSHGTEDWADGPQPEYSAFERNHINVYLPGEQYCSVVITC